MAKLPKKPLPPLPPYPDYAPPKSQWSKGAEGAETSDSWLWLDKLEWRIDRAEHYHWERLDRATGGTGKSKFRDLLWSWYNPHRFVVYATGLGVLGYALNEYRNGHTPPELVVGRGFAGWLVLIVAGFILFHVAECAIILSYEALHGIRPRLMPNWAALRTKSPWSLGGAALLAVFWWINFYEGVIVRGHVLRDGGLLAAVAYVGLRLFLRYEPVPDLPPIEHATDAKTASPDDLKERGITGEL